MAADEKIVTSGGRVIAVSSFGETFRDARTITYKNADSIEFENKYFRHDIGFDL
jgi:phosphoribosylamine--glycine ligase